MRRALWLFLIWFAAAHAAANDAAVRKYRNYTPQQISRLPEQELQSAVPMMYSMAARRGLSAGSDLLFGMELNLLMYPGLHDYVSAVKSFQADLNEKPTGVLTVWQIHQLEERAAMQRLSRVGFPDQFSSWITPEYADVQGTMIIVDDQIARPINHVRIECDKAAGTCDVNQLDFVLPDEDSWAQMYLVLDGTAEVYEIARWTKDSIESHPLGTSKNCRTTNLSFNFKTKEFYFITRNAGGDCKLPLGGELEKLTKPRVAQVVDGKKIFDEKFAEIQKKAYDALASAFRKRVEALRTQEQPQ